MSDGVVRINPDDWIQKFSMSSIIYQLRNRNIGLEYKILRSLTEDPEANRSRRAKLTPSDEQSNRYLSNVPYTENQVYVPGDSHFNASWVTCAKNPHRFIVCQAPLPHTEEAFWRMIQYHKVRLIVCLSSEEDSFNDSSHANYVMPYWSSSNKYEEKLLCRTKEQSEKSTSSNDKTLAATAKNGATSLFSLINSKEEIDNRTIKNNENLIFKILRGDLLTPSDLILLTSTTKILKEEKRHEVSHQQWLTQNIDVGFKAVISEYEAAAFNKEKPTSFYLDRTITPCDPSVSSTVQRCLSDNNTLSDACSTFNKQCKPTGDDNKSMEEKSVLYNIVCRSIDESLPKSQDVLVDSLGNLSDAKSDQDCASASKLALSLEQIKISDFDIELERKYRHTFDVPNKEFEKEQKFLIQSDRQALNDFFFSTKQWKDCNSRMRIYSKRHQSLIKKKVDNNEPMSFAFNLDEKNEDLSELKNKIQKHTEHLVKKKSEVSTHSNASKGSNDRKKSLSDMEKFSKADLIFLNKQSYLNTHKKSYIEQQKHVTKSIRRNEFLPDVSPNEKTHTYQMPGKKNSNVKVTLMEIKEDLTGHFVRREIALHEGKTKNPWGVSHIRYSNWPDMTGADPRELAILVRSILAMMRLRNLKILSKAREKEKSSQDGRFTFENPEHKFYDNVAPQINEFSGEPIVIHCSAGIGRAGTFAALLSLALDIRIQMENGIEDPEINILETVLRLRAERANAIATTDQYLLIYSTLAQMWYGDCAYAYEYVPSIIPTDILVQRLRVLVEEQKEKMEIRAKTLPCNKNILPLLKSPIFQNKSNVETIKENLILGKEKLTEQPESDLSKNSSSKNTNTSLKNQMENEIKTYVFSPTQNQANAKTSFIK